MLGLMHTNELLVTPPVPPAKGQLQEGFKYVISMPVLGSSLLDDGHHRHAHVRIPGQPAADRTVHIQGDASSYAFLTASMGVGAAIGGIVFASRKGIHTL